MIFKDFTRSEISSCLSDLSDLYRRAVSELKERDSSEVGNDNPFVCEAIRLFLERLEATGKENGQ